MSRFWVAVGLLGAACLLAPGALSQVGKGAAKATPRPEPVADTKLLMEGLAGANMRGLSKQLREKPADGDGWTFARGQALLLAETGNLLMLRPPRTGTGQDTWLGHAGDLRDAAEKLA